METTTQYFSLAYIVLPPSILDWFELVNVDEEITDPSKEKLYVGIIHIYLDERDNLPDTQKHLKANGFTEPTRINDFPIRDRKVVLHVRRRRWLDEEGHNVIVNAYPLAADGTRYSEEFAFFLKETFGYIPCDGPFCGAAVDD